MPIMMQAALFLVDLFCGDFNQVSHRLWKGQTSNNLDNSLLAVLWRQSQATVNEDARYHFDWMDSLSMA